MRKMSLIQMLQSRKRKLILLLMDVFVLFAATVGCARLYFPGEDHVRIDLIECWGILTIFLLIYMGVFDIYRFVWRHSEAKEFLQVVNAYAFTFLSTAVVKFIFGLDFRTLLALAASAVSCLCAIYLRAAYRHLNSMNTKREDTQAQARRPLAIIGAGAAGAALARDIRRSGNTDYTVWGFFDDDLSKIGMSIEGVTIKGMIEDLPALLANTSVKDVVLAIPTMDPERRREVIDICSTTKCRLKIMPEIALTLEDSAMPLSRSIRDVQIEDLLGRSSISLESEELNAYLQGKTVLVTGGGGSIGSELCRQIARAGAETIIIFDISENNSYMLQNEIAQQINHRVKLFVEIGSIVSEDRVRDVFRRYQPDVVFHAAAHKHVPLMEHCPYEAVLNNILGTRNVIEAASAEKVDRFVLISTDKAVNPTSIMGATKRYCEEMVRAFSTTPSNQTSFVAVRFGNVLGSDGSVIPLFKKQIANGGPVTVTDKRITRYFMTIQEAVGLVLKSCAMASSSETYILDMGKPVKILELAENLIRLSGLKPYADIHIVETGLRPGEKLYEELLVNDEQHIATRDAKIFIERNQNNMNWSQILQQLEQLQQAVARTDNKLVLDLMHRFVPGYITPSTSDDTVQNAELHIISQEEYEEYQAFKSQSTASIELQT